MTHRRVQFRTRSSRNRQYESFVERRIGARHSGEIDSSRYPRLIMCIFMILMTYLPPNWTSRIRSRIYTAQPDIIMTDSSVYYHRDGNHLASRFQHSNHFRSSPTMSLVTFVLQRGVCLPEGTFRRDVAMRVGGFDEDLRYGEDIEFYVRLGLSEASCDWVSEPLVHIQRRVKSHCTSATRNEQFRQHAQGILKHKLALAKEHQKEACEFLARLAADMATAGDMLCAGELL